MAYEYLIKAEHLTAIADAIRNRTSSTEGITITEMPAQIGGIVGGEDVAAETATYTNELAELQTKIAALESALEGKASGGNSGIEVWEGSVASYHLGMEFTISYQDANMEVQTIVISGFSVEPQIITVTANTMICIHNCLDCQGNNINIVVSETNGESHWGHIILVPTSNNFYIELA